MPNIPNTQAISGLASNLRAGNTTPYLVSDFLSFYPQFTTIIPEPVIQLYLDLAYASIQEERYRKSWRIAMAYFIAHFCTKFLKETTGNGKSIDDIIQAGNVQGITVSESVDSVSYSMDVGAIMSDLDGFADWKTTSFGVGLATLAKQYGKGGMMVL